MNVRTLAKMIEPNEVDATIKIQIACIDYTDELIEPNYRPENPMHNAAYGNWKVKSFVAIESNVFQFNIAVTPLTPIIED